MAGLAWKATGYLWYNTSLLASLTALGWVIGLVSCMGMQLITFVPNGWFVLQSSRLLVVSYVSNGICVLDFQYSSRTSGLPRRLGKPLRGASLGVRWRASSRYDRPPGLLAGFALALKQPLIWGWLQVPHRATCMWCLGLPVS